MGKIRIVIHDGTESCFADQRPADESYYVREVDVWPWAVAPAKGLALFLGGNSYDIDEVYLLPDGVAEVHLSTDDHTLPQSWHDQVTAEGYVLTSQLREPGTVVASSAA